MGDAAGVGPEIIVKAFNDPENLAACDVFVIGDANRLKLANEIIGSEMQIRGITTVDQAQFTPGVIDCLDLRLIPEYLPFGELSALCGDAAFQYLKRAIELAVDGQMDAICTAP